jgi:hypothetical protein
MSGDIGAVVHVRMCSLVPLKIILTRCVICCLYCWCCFLMNLVLLVMKLFMLVMLMPRELLPLAVLCWYCDAVSNLGDVIHVLIIILSYNIYVNHVVG